MRIDVERKRRLRRKAAFVSVRLTHIHTWTVGYNGKQMRNTQMRMSSFADGIEEEENDSDTDVEGENAQG